MLARLKAVSETFEREIRVYRLVLADPRTPWLARILLGAAVAYFFFPIDIIPDVIPVIGHLDDLLIVPTLLFLALKLIPREIVEEKRTEISSAVPANKD